MPNRPNIYACAGSYMSVLLVMHHAEQAKLNRPNIYAFAGSYMSVLREVHHAEQVNYFCICWFIYVCTQRGAPCQTGQIFLHVPVHISLYSDRCTMLNRPNIYACAGSYMSVLGEVHHAERAE